MNFSAFRFGVPSISAILGISSSFRGTLNKL
jgi:hypothetical protein